MTHLSNNHHYKDSSGKDIQEPPEVKDLGVLFSPDLSFRAHIDKMRKQTNKLIGWVFRTFRTRSKKVMMTVQCGAVSYSQNWTIVHNFGPPQMPLLSTC